MGQRLANSELPGDAIDRGHKPLWRSVSEFGTNRVEESGGETTPTLSMLQKNADIALMNATSDALSNITLGDAKAMRSSEGTTNPASTTAQEATSPQETNKQQQGIQTHPDGNNRSTAVAGHEAY